MEANKTTEGPQTTKDAKEHPSLKDPLNEDLYEPISLETPLQVSSSPKRLKPPEVHFETSTSLNPDTKGSEDPWDPSVSETPLKFHAAESLSPPPQVSPQSVTSLEKAIIEIPLELAHEKPISEVQEKPLEGSPTASSPEYENPISKVQKEPLEGSPTASSPEYENPISKVHKEPLEGSPTASSPEYENLISKVQKEPLEVSPTASSPEYENLISKVQKEPLEGSPTANSPESSHELTSDKVPQTQVPESEHFQKHSFSEPSTQAKEDTSTKEEEAGEDELTVGTSKITAARPDLRARKKKEKRAAGVTSRPVVPVKRAELVEMAKAVNREQFDDQVNNLFQWEKNAALKAIQTGIYIGWRCPHYLWDCFRIGDESKCFCGHLLKEHQIISDLSVPCSVNQCRCLLFCFIPSRPEEVGEFWLTKRATFDPKAWRAQCRCKHTHEEHAATGAHPCRHRGCNCSSFESNFLCAACDRRWEEHETFFETGETRRRGKRPYGTNTFKNWHRPF